MVVINETVLNPFTPWAEPFLEWMDENDIKPKAGTLQWIISRRYAGDDDFLGEDSDGKKCFLRTTSAEAQKTRRKFLSRVSTQLAVEANAIKNI